MASNPKFSFLAMALACVTLHPARCLSAEIENPKDLENIMGSLALNRRKVYAVAPRLSELGVDVAFITHWPEPKISINVSSRPISEIMNAIVTQLPGYEWGFSSGTISLWPAAPEAAIANRILQSTIPAISSADEYDARSLYSLLEGHAANAGLPVSSRNSKFARERPLREGILADELMSIDIPSGTRLIDALTAISKSAGHGYWLVMLEVGPREILHIEGGSTKVGTGPTLGELRQIEAIRKGKVSPYAEPVYSSDKLEHELPR